MGTRSRAEEKFSVALESIQGKRRIERIMEAANALLDRYATQPDPEERLRLVFELIRRNLTDRISVVFGDLALGTPVEPAAGGTEFRCEIHVPGGGIGRLTASYTPPGSMGLTDSEWRDAMRLLAGIGGLGAGGYVRCLE